MTNNSIILFEHQIYSLEHDEALKLEESCRKVWRERSSCILYDCYYKKESDNDSLAQNLIKFHWQADGTVTVKPGGYIGIITTGCAQYLILPKIFQNNDVLFAARYLDRMFSFSTRLKMMESASVSSGIEACSTIFSEILINTFANRTLALLSQRQYNSYQEIAENIGTVRGRIDFSEQIRKNIASGRHDRIACTFELFQEDNLFNRIVKYVCSLLISRTHLYENRRILSATIAHLEDVTEQRVNYRDCLKVRLNAYQQDYIPILDYCKMFLSFRMADVSSGEYGIDHVFIQTSSLFENFAAGYLASRLPSDWTLEVKKRGYLVVENNEDLFQYENDLLLKQKNSGSVIIGDAKYKQIDLSNREEKYGISQADIYQMISYAVRRGADKVLLLYPGTKITSSQFRTLKVVDERSNSTIRIQICQIPMDLNLQDNESEFEPEWLKILMSNANNIDLAMQTGMFDSV